MSDTTFTPVSFDKKHVKTSQDKLSKHGATVGDKTLTKASQMNKQGFDRFMRYARKDQLPKFLSSY